VAASRCQRFGAIPGPATGPGLRSVAVPRRRRSEAAQAAGAHRGQRREGGRQAQPVGRPDLARLDEGPTVRGTSAESPLAIMAARRSTLSTSAPPKSAKRRNAIIPAVWTTPVLAVEAVRENVEAVRPAARHSPSERFHRR